MLLQDVILLVLAVIGVVLGFPVVIVLRRLPARIQRLVLVTYVIASGVAMALAWGIGGLPMSSVNATGLWLGAASTGLAALLLLGTDLAVAVWPSGSLGARRRLLVSSAIALCVLIVGPIATAERCAQGIAYRCSVVPEPLVENVIVALAIGVSSWTVLSVIAVRRLDSGRWRHPRLHWSTSGDVINADQAVSETSRYPKVQTFVGRTAAGS